MEIYRTSEGFEAFIDGKSAGYIVLDFGDDVENRANESSHSIATMTQFEV